MKNEEPSMSGDADDSDDDEPIISHVARKDTEDLHHIKAVLINIASE
jgi:hypothetical protein